MLIIVVHILWILLQFLLSITLYVLFYKFFERICAKDDSRSLNSSDIIKEGKATARIILFTGIAILCVALVINIFYVPLIGFYLSAVFFIFLGKGAFFYPKGRKITANCWVTPYQRDDFIVTLNDRKILISGERLWGKPGHVIYTNNSTKWLPPHDDEPVPEKDYEYMLEAILKFLKNDGVIQRPGEDRGQSITREDIISRYTRKGWKVEESSTGIKVSPPQRTKKKIWGR